MAAAQAERPDGAHDARHQAVQARPQGGPRPRPCPGPHQEEVSQPGQHVAQEEEERPLHLPADQECLRQPLSSSSL